MTKFATIRETAEQRAGGPAALKKLLPKSKSVRALKAVPDDRYLSLMSLRVFSAGLKHSMVAGKWPDFEEIFYAFEPKRVAAIADEDLDRSDKHKTSAVHFLRFELNSSQIQAFKSGARLSAGIDHKNYQVEISPVMENIRNSLLGDLD